MGAWPSSTTSWLEAARRQWDCGSGCDGIDRPWDGEARTQGLNDRDGQFLRLGVASELQRSEGWSRARCAAGWLRWAEQDPSFSHRLASGAGRRGPGGRRPSGGHGRLLLSAAIEAGGVDAFGDHADPRSTRARRGHRLRHLRVDDRRPPGPGPRRSRGALQRVGLRGTNVRVLSCDAQVHSVKRVSRASQVELLGGGGTDMGEGITQALALRPRPSIVVVLTDGFTPWPDGSSPRRQSDRRPHRRPSWHRPVDACADLLRLVGEGREDQRTHSSGLIDRAEAFAQSMMLEQSVRRLSTSAVPHMPTVAPIRLWTGRPHDVNHGGRTTPCRRCSIDLIGDNRRNAWASSCHFGRSSDAPPGETNPMCTLALPRRGGVRGTHSRI